MLTSILDPVWSARATFLPFVALEWGVVLFLLYSSGVRRLLARKGPWPMLALWVVGVTIGAVMVGFRQANDLVVGPGQRADVVLTNIFLVETLLLVVLVVWTAVRRRGNR